jgi:Chalcone isomerase-like
MASSARLLLPVFIFLFGFCRPVFAAEVAGVKMEEKEALAGTELVLNGAGLRSKFVFKVYAMALYLPAKTTDAAAAIGASGPKRVAMHMLRDVGADEFGEALMNGMRDNNSEAAMKVLEPCARQLVSIMAAMKEAKEGMRITLDWLPGTGTVVGVNGKDEGAPIPGEDFYRGLLRIWLGENPVQEDLKRALLGGKP